jgi:hypothetical protein
MDADARCGLELLGSRLSFEFSANPLPAHATGAAAAAALDWLCSMCQAKNFCRWGPPYASVHACPFLGVSGVLFS